jgi:hypothetical protein
MPVDARISARRFDFSRETFDQSRHRRSVVSLQGRVTVEADSNEQRRIDLHRADTTARDVIGPAGVPSNSDAFKITGGGPDLSIDAGHMFVEGILCENETKCSLLNQPDLPVTALADVPGFSGAGTYAVELLVWERDITPIDDPGVLEKALGGPDTSARTETVWQAVLNKQAGNATCQTADLGTPVAHDGMLSAQTVPSAATRDCTLPPLAGFQGLENQLYRIEIHKAGAAGVATFKWSRENGSVVTAIVNPTSGTLGQKFNVSSIGADQTLGFAANQWVELTDDIIELKGDVGELALIQLVDPAKLEITLANPPAKTIDLTKNPKMRRWDQTGAGLGNGVATLSGGIWIPLELGIQVRFDSGSYVAGDYWIIPARTAIDEETGILDFPTAPQPARYAARQQTLLAVVPFDGTNFGTASDCRPKFDDLVTLTKRNSCCCCTVTVGDGKKSIGDYKKISDALAALPPEGGEICVLDGTYAESVKISKAKNIRIHGCHSRTQITGVAGMPVISIEDSQQIKISALGIDTSTEIGISISSTAAGLTTGSGSAGITLEELEIAVRDSLAIICRDASDVRIASNEVVVNQLAAPLNSQNDIGFAPALFVQAELAEIDDNFVHCEEAPPLTTALGGIQIGGGSTRVKVRSNRIEGGNGNGITLGSITFIDAAAAKDLQKNYAKAIEKGQPMWGYSSGVYVDDAGCVHVGGGGGGALPGGENPPVPVSEGMLEDVRILDNDITGMGGSGIADIPPPNGMEGIELVAVLDIERNWINGCAQLDRGATGAAGTALPGRGGIALTFSEYATIRDNMIAANGKDHTRSICGIWTFLSFGIVIERNQIINNGPFVDTNQNLEPGPRGGIVIEWALRAIDPFLVVPVETGYPAARVHGNIVATNSGPALAMFGSGTVSIDNNELTSHGRDQPANSPYLIDQVRVVLGGAAVFVWNFATTVEVSGLIADFLSMPQHQLSLSGSSTSLAGGTASTTLAGDTMFNDNQVLMDGPFQANVVSAITILTFGDLSFEGNQSSADLGNVSMGSGALLIALSVRAAGNRFQETFGHALFSAITMAYMNTTTDNQGTHCFAVIYGGSQVVNSPNLSLIEISPGSDDPCVDAVEAIGGLVAKNGWKV